jgi:small subunit ribosomal protein S16
MEIHQKLGSYNPLTVPASIQIDRQKALDWLHKGAQPTDTVRRILSFKGVLFLKHFIAGVTLGLFDEATAMEKFTNGVENMTPNFPRDRNPIKRQGPQAGNQLLEEPAEQNNRPAGLYNPGSLLKTTSEATPPAQPAALLHKALKQKPKNKSYYLKYESNLLKWVAFFIFSSPSLYITLLQLMNNYFKVGKLVATYGLKGEIVLQHSLGKRHL